MTVVAAGRFIQYRAKLTTTDPRRTPELRSVSLSYRTSNLAPEISRLDVPDLSTADGAARQTRLNLRWDATDPNDDDLSYTLKVRKEGWPEWIELTDEPITEKTFAWDTTAFPSGTYRLKLMASDRPSNSPDDALTRDRESVTFIVDHDPPAVTVTPRKSGAAIVLKDELTRLVKADYALDGGRWVPIFPDDGLFDTVHEKDHALTAGLEAGRAPGDGARHRFGRQCWHRRCAHQGQEVMVGRSRGVTLVEVIVVLAIVTIALLILLMMIPRGREQARLLACQKNLGQIGKALAIYHQTRASASDHRRARRNR